MEANGASDHRVWKVLAWVVGTLVAVGGLVVGVLQYQDAQRAERERKEKEARAAVVETCARATDVFDTILALWYSATRGSSPQVDLPALREQLRALNESANRTESANLRQAASAVRSRFGLLTEQQGYTPQIAQEISIGVVNFGVILSECQRAGRPIPSMPPDVAAGLQTGAPAASGPAVLGVTVTDIGNGHQGAFIQSVTPGSVAAACGLQPGDVIVGVGGATVTDVATLHQALGQHGTGQTVQVAFLRNGSLATTVAAF